MRVNFKVRFFAREDREYLAKAVRLAKSGICKQYIGWGKYIRHKTDRDGCGFSLSVPMTRRESRSEQLKAAAAVDNIIRSSIGWDYIRGVETSIPSP